MTDIKTDPDSMDDDFDAAALRFIEEQERSSDRSPLDAADSDQHHSAFGEIADTWDALDLLNDAEFPELAEFDSQRSDDVAIAEDRPSPVVMASQTSNRIQKSLWRQPTTWGAMAAAVLIALAIPISYLGVPNAYSVAKGEQLSVAMNDGSTLELSSNTQVSVQEGWGRRGVTLIQGNVFFDITPDQEKPFTIDTGNSVVTVLGTSFNIYRKGELLEVVVKSGKVNVAKQATEKSSQINVDLTKNAKATITRNGQLELEQGIDIENAIAWREGFIHFKQETLEMIIERMSDFYEKPIHIMNKKQRSILLSGAFKTDDFDNFLIALQAMSTITVEHSPSGTILIH